MAVSAKEAKAEARVRLHDRLAVSALVYAHGPEGGSSPTRLRIGSKVEPIGSLSGSGITYAERLEDNPRLIFLVSEHIPQRGLVYSVEEDLAFRAEAIEPREGVTVAARASRLSQTEARTYMAPEV